MKNITCLSVLALTLLASTVAYAAGAGTTELKVTGVIKPAACTPSLTGGGTIDYGLIPTNSLSTTAPNVLAEKTVPFAVTCDAATKVSVRTVDNRKASVIRGLMAAINSEAGGFALGDEYAYGLGTSSGKNIGVYSVRIVQGSFTADGTVPDLVYEAGTAWARSTHGRFINDGQARQAFAVAGTVVPNGYKILTGTLGVQVVIDKASNLPLTTDVILDGSATVEVMYL